jgi:hypothetical protein
MVAKGNPGSLLVPSRLLGLKAQQIEVSEGRKVDRVIARISCLLIL